MEAVGIPCRNKCVCYKMSANYRKKPIVINVDDIEKSIFMRGTVAQQMNLYVLEIY